MGLDRVLAHEELGGDFAITHSLSDQLRDFQFTRRNRQLRNLLFIQDKRRRSWNRDLANDNLFGRLRQRETQPNADPGKDRRDQPAINLKGMLNDQKSILHPLQKRDQDTAGESIYKDASQ